MLPLSVWSLHVLPVYAWVLSGYTDLPPSKNMHARLIDESKLSLGVSVSVHGCVSLCLCVALWCTGDLSRVYPASRPMTAGIGSTEPTFKGSYTPNRYEEPVVARGHLLCLLVLEVSGQIQQHLSTPQRCQVPGRTYIQRLYKKI